MAALLCIGFLFMLQTYVATIIQPDMSRMNPDTAFFDAAELAAGDWFRKVLLVVNILAVGIANTMNAQAATSRVLYGMSRDNVLPGVSGLFRKVHPASRPPTSPPSPWASSLHPGGRALHRGRPGPPGELRRPDLLHPAESRRVQFLLAPREDAWRQGPAQLCDLPLLRRAHPRLYVALLRQHDPDRGLQLAGRRPGHRLRQEQGATRSSPKPSARAIWCNLQCRS